MPQRQPPVASSPSEPLEDEELDIALIVLRAALRWKQNDLAKASGIGNSSISDYERRKKVPGRKNLRKMLQSMGYRESVLEVTRRFLQELRNSQRLAPGESVDLAAEGTVGKLGGAGGMGGIGGIDEAGWRARIAQVTGEVGQTTEHVIQLVLELLMARTPPPGE
jgi:transcriptional regulator with XRE-family HTH domain